MFAKNVLKLTSGNIIAQVITLAAIPIITRIYLPENYGGYAIYLALTAVLIPLSTFHFNRAMMLPKDRNDAINLLALSFISVTGFSLFLTLIALVIKFGAFAPKAWINEGISKYLWFIPFGILIQGYFRTVIFWSLRNKKFGNMAIARINASIADRGFVLSFGFLFNANAIGLIGGRIVGPFFALCYMIRRIIIPEIKVFYKELSFTKMKSLAYRYKKFPLFSTLAFFVNNFAREAPLLFLGLFFSPVIVGFYGLALRVINMPMKLIGDAISKVFLQKATADSEKGKISAIDTIGLFSFLIYFSLPGVLILINYGDVLFGLIFGTKWSEAGVYSQILSFSFFAMFLYRPLSVFFDAFERQKQRLVFNLLLLSVRSGTIIVTALITKSVYITLIALALSTILIYICAYIYLFNLVGINAKNLLGIFISKAALMAPLILGMPISKLFLHENYLLTWPILASILLLQGIVLFLFEPRIKQETMHFLVRLSHNRSLKTF